MTFVVLKPALWSWKHLLITYHPYSPSVLMHNTALYSGQTWLGKILNSAYHIVRRCQVPGPSKLIPKPCPRGINTIALVLVHFYSRRNPLVHYEACPTQVKYASVSVVTYQKKNINYLRIIPPQTQPSLAFQRPISLQTSIFGEKEASYVPTYPFTHSTPADCARAP
ncbi:hypothetical protein L873DRAFT_1494747 [Choiromyces venosus 120613-1]|uniref:Uncharacterized protein n=1 Tax=Choiromyces venosus 120613-1 TaxID=1336337 RepID=A0A3N4JBU8_9PEZI|nr:hypothetical protein L873DRAFT_1494747 [Choiromyces venosus 120613-1]